MELQIALAGSPLAELHTPKTNDIKYLNHEINRIPEVRKGKVAIEVNFGHKTKGDHDSAVVEARSDNGNMKLSFFKQGKNWIYSGELEINGKVSKYAGQTHHDSPASIVRKVRALIMRIA